MNRHEKYPELSKVYDKLVEERDAILAKVAPLQAEAQALQDEEDKLRARLRAVRQKIVDTEGTRLREVCNQIAALARSMNARSIKAEGGAVGVKAGQ